MKTILKALFLLVAQTDDIFVEFHQNQKLEQGVVQSSVQID